jgi:copper(I)-binding protein
MIFSWFLVSTIFTIGLTACQGAGDLHVDDAWARPGSAGSNSAVYFRIDNPGNLEDELLEASSPSAEQAEIHRSELGADETMSMHHQENVQVPARGQLRFEPGGYHVMLVNLREDLNEGDQIEVTLHFQESGEIILLVPIEQR